MKVTRQESGNLLHHAKSAQTREWDAGVGAIRRDIAASVHRRKRWWATTAAINSTIVTATLCSLFYERRTGRDRIHMACLRCGKITEFQSEIFDSLKRPLERDCRFNIVVTRLEVGGYCASCSK